MSLELKTHSGRTVESTRVFKTLRRSLDKPWIGFSDLDNTAIVDDAGKQLFLELISYRKFWERSLNKFKSLLLPKDYFKFVSHQASGALGANGNRTEIQELCHDIYFLYHEVLDHYEILREMILDYENGQPYDLDEDLMLNEFARKMWEMDLLIMRAEEYFSKEFGGDLLMRTRLWAKIARKMDLVLATDNLVQRKSPAVSALGIHEENRENLGPLSLVKELENIEVSRVLRIVEGTRELIEELTTGFGAKFGIITTNLEQVAETIRSKTAYNDLIDPDLVFGSALGVKKNGQFMAKLDGLPVIGEEKRRIARRIADETKRDLAVVLGDSFGGDGRMFYESLSGGGVAVAVGKDYRETRAKFDPIVRMVRRKQGQEAKGLNNRMLYLAE